MQPGPFPFDSPTGEVAALANNVHLENAFLAPKFTMRGSHGSHGLSLDPRILPPSVLGIISFGRG